MNDRTDSLRSWSGTIPIASRYTVGIGGEMFLSALRKNGKLVGTRCRPCDQTYVPARGFCERCFAEITETIEIQPQGDLVSYTICYVDHDAKPLRRPVALALVKFDGATTFFLHRLLDWTEDFPIEIGARVIAVIKPKSKRKGSVLDIEGFRLAGVPASQEEK